MATLTWAHTGKKFAIHRFSAEIREQIKELNKTDNWHSLVFFAQDVFWVGLCVLACHLVSWWLYPLALIMVGARQRALSTIFHDCVHGTTPTRSRTCTPTTRSWAIPKPTRI
jgi:fatty acid desaturase